MSDNSADNILIVLSNIFGLKYKTSHSLVLEKDYISKPKKSGYASYHIVLEVPVNVAGKIIYVKTEIQINKQ